MSTTDTPVTRVVIFMTARRAADIPDSDNVLACLLPFGASTFAERTLDSCAQAGVREVDIVVSEDPESVRQRLEDGSAWGIQLRWHFAKETETPYGVLHGLGLNGAQHVVIGHGHQWIAERVLRSLVQKGGIAMHVDNQVHWTGWCQLDGKAIASLSPHIDHAGLTKVAAALASPQLVLARHCEFARPDSAAGLLAAQNEPLLDIQNISGGCIPASWRRTPWGAMSPDAIVHPHAQMIGPVLVGPQCVVESLAQVGPNTVLSRDVLVAQGAVVYNTLILANTYVDGRVTLEHALAQGNSVQNLKWSVRTTLPIQDTLLTPLVAENTLRTPWKSRLIALLTVLLLLPAFVLLLAVRRASGNSRMWRSMQAVRSRDQEGHSLSFLPVRVQELPAGMVSRWSGFYGAMLDVVQGRRIWFGIRPRDASEWYTLGRDWQDLFSRASPGVFHAPAWSEKSHSVDHEARAAADAYLTVDNSLMFRLRILKNSW